MQCVYIRIYVYKFYIIRTRARNSEPCSFDGVHYQVMFYSYRSSRFVHAVVTVFSSFRLRHRWYGGVAGRQVSGSPNNYIHNMYVTHYYYYYYYTKYSQGIGIINIYAYVYNIIIYYIVRYTFTGSNHPLALAHTERRNYYNAYAVRRRVFSPQLLQSIRSILSGGHTCRRVLLNVRVCVLKYT